MIIIPLLLIVIHLLLIPLFCVAVALAQTYLLEDTLVFHRSAVKFICLVYFSFVVTF